MDGARWSRPTHSRPAQVSGEADEDVTCADLAAHLPGEGSSSGSAVAVAEGSADVGYGTDTGGSVRIPAAFCGLAGLKTTIGRIGLEGVWPLAPSLDTVGPIAADVAGLTVGMALLEPGFAVTQSPATRIGRLRPQFDQIDPRVDAAVDAALVASGVETVELDAVDWAGALIQTYILTASEAVVVDAQLMAARTASATRSGHCWSSAPP